MSYVKSSCHRLLQDFLSGGTVDVSADPVCIDETITFTASGVVDSGGIERVQCVAKQGIPGVTPSYTWEITKPDATIVSGSGSVATVIADQPGNNYRAAASLLLDAVGQSQLDQTDADALNQTRGGGWSGYGMINVLYL